MTALPDAAMPSLAVEAAHPTSGCLARPLGTFRELVVGPTLGLFLLLLPLGVDAQVMPVDGIDVRVVEHDHPPAGGEVWTVSPEPFLRLGSHSDRPHELFSQIPDVLQRTDGALVVLDRTTSELRTFSGDGEHMWTAGGRGEGPGEFQWGVGSIHLMPGDFVLAAGTGGVSPVVFDPEGVYVRSLRLSEPGPGLGPLNIFASLGDRGFVGVSAVRSGEPLPQGYTRAQIRPVLVDFDGEILEAPGELRGIETYRDMVEVPGPEGRMVSAQRQWRMVMGRVPVVAAGQETFVVSDQTEFEVLRYDSTGSLDHVLRFRKAPVPVTAAFRREYATAMLADPEASRDRAFHENRRMPDTLPAHGRPLVDRSEHVWIEEFVPVQETRDRQTWWVLDRNGQFVATVHLPVGFVLHVVGEDHVVGVSLDSSDVPFVELRRILR